MQSYCANYFFWRYIVTLIRSSTSSFVQTKYSVSISIRTVRTARVKWLHVAPLLSCGLILLVNAHAPSAVSAFSNRFSVFVWMGENDSKTLRVDANFFENGEKKLRFQTKTDTCGRGLRLFKAA